MNETSSFTLFGPPHLVTIAVIVLLSVALPLGVRWTRSERLARRVAVGLAALLVGHEIWKTWMWVVVYDDPLARHLPVQICGLSVLLAAIMLVWRTYPVYEVIYFWGLAGTLQAVLTPDVRFGYPHPLYFGFFISHGLIIVAVLYATLVFRMRPTARSIPRVFLITLAYALFYVTPINLLLETNYMYLRHEPPAASLLHHFGSWPWYIGLAAVFALVSFAFYYSPFWIMDRLGGGDAWRTETPQPGVLRQDVSRRTA